MESKGILTATLSYDLQVHALVSRVVLTPKKLYKILIRLPVHGTHNLCNDRLHKAQYPSGTIRLPFHLR